MMLETDWDRRQRLLTLRWFRTRPHWRRLLQMAQAEQMLERILEAIRAKSPSDALDTLYDEVDDALLKGQFAIVDEVLDAIDPQEIPTLHLLGFLTITNLARNRLKARSSLVTRVRAHLEVLEADRVKSLLAGLE